MSTYDQICTDFKMGRESSVDAALRKACATVDALRDENARLKAKASEGEKALTELRLDHGFGLPSMDLRTGNCETPEQHARRQEVILQDVDRFFEEVRGDGFYTPANDAWYESHDKTKDAR